MASDTTKKNGIVLRYTVHADNFTRAGEASSAIKTRLKQMGFAPDFIRRVAIAIYEGEINMVIHADGGEIVAEISPEYVEVTLSDKGPGIPDTEVVMQTGYSTAPENIRNLGFGAGMGLPNIKKYTDELDIQTEVGVGTTVRTKVYTTRP